MRKIVVGSLRGIAVLAVMVVAFVAGHEGVSRASHVRARRPVASSDASSSDAPRPYPHRAFWRDPKDINRVVVRPSHILISFGERDRLDTIWMPQRPPTRSRAEALALATRLSNELEVHPSSFADYAARYSDDESTRALGGAMGAQRVVRLPIPLVEALAAIEPGEVSRPVETEAGFHVLSRGLAPIEPVRVSGRQILIGYVGAAMGGAIERSRADAKALATSLVARLRQHPEEFLAVAREHSSAPRAAEDADFGPFTAYDLWAEPVVVHVLEQTAIGAITDPIDTPTGFLIVQRDERVAPETIAASFLGVAIAPPSDAPASLREAQRRIARLAARVTRAVDDFDSLRTSAECDAPLCSAPQLEWHVDHVPPGAISDALVATSVGALHPQPIRVDDALYVLRRNPPSASSLNVYRDTFPDESPWTIEDFVERGDPGRTSVFVSQFRQKLAADATIPEPKRAVVDRALEEFDAALRDSPSSERRALYAEVRARIRSALSPTEHEEFDRALRRWFDEMTRL